MTTKSRTIVVPGAASPSNLQTGIWKTATGDWSLDWPLGLQTPDPSTANAAVMNIQTVLGATLFTAAGGIVWDGSFLWVADSQSYSNNVENPTANFIRVFDTSTNPPTLVASVDCTSFQPFQACRKLRLSSDGTKIYASFGGWAGGTPATINGSFITAGGGGTATISCTPLNQFRQFWQGRQVTVAGATNPGNNGTFKILSWIDANTMTIQNPAAVTENPFDGTFLVHPSAGFVLIIDVASRTILGKAQMNAGIIGASSFQAIGARDAIDDNAGNLWAVNSNQSTGNILEKFNIASVISSYPTPVTSVQTVSVAQHAEELALLGGFLWTGGAAYTRFVSRIDPTNGNVVTWNSTTSTFAGGSGWFPWGMTALFGALWSGDFNNHVVRYDPAQFGTSAFATDFVTITGSTNAQNGFASDGTHLWFGNTGVTSGNFTVFEFSTTGGSVAILNSVTSTDGFGGGPQELAFDGTHIWGTRRTPVNPHPSGLVEIDPVGHTIVNQLFTGQVFSLVWSPNWFPTGPAGTGGIFDSLSGTYPNPFVRMVGGVLITPTPDQTSQGGAVPFLTGSQANPPTATWVRIPDGDNGISHRSGLDRGVQQTRVDPFDLSFVPVGAPQTATSIIDVCTVQLRTTTVGTNSIPSGEYLAVLCRLSSSANDQIVLVSALTQYPLNQYDLGASGHTKIVNIGGPPGLENGDDFVVVLGGGNFKRVDLQLNSVVNLSQPVAVEGRCHPFFDGQVLWVGNTSPGIWRITDPWGVFGGPTITNVVTLPASGNDPHVVDITSDGDFIYYLFDSTGGSPFYYSEIQTLNFDGTAGPPRVPNNLGPGAFQPPASLAYDGKHLWVGFGNASVTPKVQRIDRFGNTALNSWTPSTSNHGGAIVRFDGQYIWILLSGEAGLTTYNVFKVDPSQREFFDTPLVPLTVGSQMQGFSNPSALAATAASRDGASVYVVCTGNTKLRAVEDSHNTIVRTLKITGGTVDNVRAITQASYLSPYRVTGSDTAIAVGTTTTAYAILLPQLIAVGRRILVWDDAGTAATRNITLQVENTAWNIDGAATLVLNQNFQAVVLEFTGTRYKVIGTTGGGGAVPAPLPSHMMFTAGVFSAGTSTPTRCGAKFVDLTEYPATYSTFNRTVTFFADIETTAGTANVRLYNVTDGEVVTGTQLTTTNTTNTEVSVVVTVGSLAGNLKTGKYYEVDVWITGGGVSDRATCTNARLRFSYA